MRISIVIAALALSGSAMLNVSSAWAQGTSQGGSAFDKCVAQCKQSGVSNSCSSWCENKRR
jgi:hypothetical protein